MKKLDVFYDIMVKNITIFLICLFSALSIASEVVIWATTDMHGNLLSGDGGMARILSILEQKRRSQDILIDAGDMFQGSFVANSTAGDIVISAFNLMNYDFFVPGNHEFEFGSVVLRKNFEKINAQILCANWRFVPAMDKMRPYTVIERSKIRIAIIGAGERESRCRILPCKDMLFANEEKAITLTLNKLRKERVDIIILVRHGGIYFKGGSLYSLLKKFPEIDLVIGGHSHQLERGRRIAGAYYVQPGMMARGISEIRIKFNKRNRKIERMTSDYHDAADFKPSAAMSGVLAESKMLMRAGWKNLAVPLPEKRDDIENVQRYLTLYAAKKNAEAEAHLFFVEKTSLKCIRKINHFLLYRLFPYENNLVTVPVTDREYKDILAEARRYADKHKLKLITKVPSKKSFMLQTTSFILSGGGANFPESRKIAEKKMPQLKVYPSLRQVLINSKNN